MKTAGVVGLGVMGFDIAFLYAAKGYQTLVYDVSTTAMASLEKRREQTVDRLKRRNRISEAEVENVHRLLIRAQSLADLRFAGLITEAVSEKPKTKMSVYRDLADAGFTGILTTNTSSVTRASLLDEGSYDAGKFALTHFFNPVLYTRMVEVVRGDMHVTHSEAVLSFLRSLGREPIETRDISGFVSNGILMIYAVMALRLLESGARIEQVDAAARDLQILPPFISFDSWKPSIVEDVTRMMFELRGDSFLRSSKLLGELARKNPPFYVNGNPNSRIYELAEVSGANLDEASIKMALSVAILVAAARVAELGETPPTVDFVAVEGIKIPQPPLKQIDSLGAAELLRELDEINHRLAQGPLEAPRLLKTMADEGQTFYRGGECNPWLEAQSRN
ncbi:MAG TPA: 3-hydroxyacyl-CoA dehydrogenase NAD-binding domain-containing protein [Candidatus Binatia bacterium]|nr:3-hydroxyacyl-CoA dehydrogenase NAD-binding domain-containing protein [Candidatus Binatia bacterium]